MSCKLHTNSAGYLSLRCYHGGREWREGTRATPNTAENRAKLGRLAARVSASMKAGAFTYLDWFPHGNRASEFTPAAPVHEQTLKDYFDEWIVGQATADKRPTRAYRYRQHWNAYIGPMLGELPIRMVDFRALEALQAHCLGERGLSVTTVKGIVGGTLSAMLSHAVSTEVITANPVRKLKWERVQVPEPDPYTEAERDALIEYFRGTRWYGFVYFAFWTGCRPSETTALRWDRVDLQQGTIRITTSRVLGSEAAPKTPASLRTLRMIPNVIEMLRELRPVHVTPESYVFLNSGGKPVHTDRFVKQYWHRALRVCDIRPRPFYNCRHTYISLALSHNVNIRWLTTQTGTSITMIEKHYGRWLEGVADPGLAEFLPSTNPSTKKPKSMISGS